MRKNRTNLLAIFGDLFVRLLPKKKRNNGGFAFLVHARGFQDVYKRLPILKYLPKKVVEKIIFYMWPFVVSEITGLKSQINGELIRGWLIGFPMTAKQMMENREVALEKIVKSAQLAEKLGANIVGLGALTSSLSQGGHGMVDRVSINVTTGHAYTAYIVTANLFELTKKLQLDKTEVTVAIVGAAGSVGSTSAKMIAREDYKKIVLVDIERKNPTLQELIIELKQLNNSLQIEVSHQIQTIKKADFIITATNAPEVVIKADDLKSGAVIIDDAQPSDVAPEVLDRDDVLVVEGGVVHTPGISAHFNFGLVDKYDNYCCLGELLSLSSVHWNDHYVVGRADLKLVDQIVSIAKKNGFGLATFQNRKGLIDVEYIDRIKNIHQQNKNCKI